MSERIKILAKIDELHDSNCLACSIYDNRTTNTVCTTKCEVGKELQRLGERLLEPRKNKLETLLEKGKDLTWSDIYYLLEQEVPRKRIAKAIGIYVNNFNKMLREFEEVKAV